MKAQQHAVVRAAAALGGAVHLAHALGVTGAAVSHWASGKRPVPANRCVAIEKVTNGAVRRQELRPDDWRSFWPELDAAAEPAANEVTARG